MSEPHPVFHLLKWLTNFEVAASVNSISDISDGVILSLILHSICAKFFTAAWLDQFTVGAALDQEAKVVNLQKIFIAVRSFLSQLSNRPITNLPVPKFSAIAQHEDEDETFRLLQLILTCAVNCETREVFVEQIMRMEETVQHVLMEAIQQLMSVHSDFSPTMEAEEPRVSDQSLEMKKLVAEKLELLKRCEELELQCTNLTKERDNLRSTLVPEGRPTSRTSGSMESLNPLELSTVDELHSSALATVRIGQLQDQVTKLREELYNTDIVKEELNVKLAESLNTIHELRQKCDVLGKQAADSVHLKDELDIAREELASLSHLSHSVELLKKRASEAMELRVRCAKLERENKVCIDRINELERELRLCSSLRSQLTQRTKFGDMSTDDDHDAAARISALETLLHERTDELTEARQFQTRTISDLSKLKTSFDELLTTFEASGALKDELSVQNQLATLRNGLSTLYRLLKTTGTKDAGGDDSVQPDSASSVSPEESSCINALLTESVDSTLSPHAELKASETSNHSVSEIEQRYRRYLWKASVVIKTLEREARQREETLRCLELNQSNNTNPDVERLRALLVEKEAIIEKLERHHEQMRLQRDAEERILLSAWYNLGIRNTRFTPTQSNGYTNGRVTPLFHSTISIKNKPDELAGISFLDKQRELHLKSPTDLPPLVTTARGSAN